MFTLKNKILFPDFTSPTGGSLTSFGSPSKTVILASEEEKIAIEFTASADIKKGQLVKLDANGDVTPWAKADGRTLVLGYALSDVANGGLVTIQTRGYAIIYGISAAAQNAGMATINGYDTATVVGQLTGYNTIAITATDSEMVGWALDKTTAIGVLIRFLIKD